MLKAKVYRVIGSALSIIGVLGWLLALLKKLDAGFLPAVYSVLGELAFNIFLWAGLLFLWRADKNKNPQKKSKWLKVIKVYAIFAAIMMIREVIFW